MILGTFLGEMVQQVYFICTLADNLYSIFYVSVMIISITTFLVSC
jgi:hypothetical protein